MPISFIQKQGIILARRNFAFVGNERWLKSFCFSPPSRNLTFRFESNDETDFQLSQICFIFLSLSILFSLFPLLTIEAELLHYRTYPRGALHEDGRKQRQGEGTRHVLDVYHVASPYPKFNSVSLMHYSLEEGRRRGRHIRRRVRISKSGLFDIYFHAVQRGAGK